MKLTDSPRSHLVDHGLMFLAGVPACYHCHHFNLFLDQTVDDALGPQEGLKLRFLSARSAAFDLLQALAARAGASTPAEIIQLAEETFAGMGHGRLSIRVDADGGEAHGDHLHYGYSWREKYGHLVKRHLPADAFAAGFAAAAASVAFGRPPSMGAEEDACLVARAPRCHFTLKPEATPEPHRGSLSIDDSRAHVKPPLTGMNEEEITTIAAGLRDFTASVSGDERGLVQAFGVYVTAHLTCYYNRLTYDTLDAVARSAPQSVPVVEDLFRESAHVCVFNTFGGILLSPEWEGLVAPLEGNPEEIVTGCMAIGRALGFGQWVLQDFVPNERLVMRTPSSYESVYTLHRRGVAERAIEYFSQGATLAIAQLAHRVPWSARPALDSKLYAELFRGHLPWKIEQTRSLAMGHDYSEIVATHNG